VPGVTDAVLTGESAPSQAPSHFDAVPPEMSTADAWPGSFDELAGRVIPRIEREIAVAVEHDVDDAWMRGAIGYQFGWTDSDFAELASAERRSTGKRLRPMLAVLCYLAALDPSKLEALAGVPPLGIVTFAAAVELLHNFSLIHDDIADRDRSRRGRPTLWTLCGEAQATNVGDCAHALAYAAVARLAEREIDDRLADRLVCTLARATVDMTVGQRRDMTYETTTEVDAQMYAQMIAGKTAALMACATYGGALLAIGDADPAAGRRTAGYAEFGHELGLCFQVRDDILGIWGVEAETGKSTGSDIRRRKKSLPIVLALGAGTAGARARLAALYALEIELSADQEREVRDLLGACEANELSQRQADRHAERALAALADASAGLDENHFLDILRSLAGSLTARSS
jgi:geranylgeranyl diphosphate synthase, type I